MDCADIAVAVLAAGRGTRFGSDKLMADLDGTPLGLHIARTISPMGFGWRFAICANENPNSGHSRERVNPVFEVGEKSGIPAFAAMTGGGSVAEHYSRLDFAILANDRLALGQSHSLHLAVCAAEATEAEALMIMLADMPFVSARHIAKLTAQSGLTASTDGIKAMPPALFPRKHWPQLLQTTGDTGARDLLRHASLVRAPASELRDIDVPADLPKPPVQ